MIIVKDDRLWEILSSIPPFFKTVITLACSSCSQDIHYILVSTI